MKILVKGSGVELERYLSDDPRCRKVKLSKPFEHFVRGVLKGSSLAPGNPTCPLEIQFFTGDLERVNMT